MDLGGFFQNQILTKTKAVLAALVFFALFFPIFQIRAVSSELVLVTARDNIPGSFTTSQSLYADKNRIYLASAQGTIFVLERDLEKNFPLLESINLSSSLTAVVADGSKLYVASNNGSIYIFEIPKSTASKLNQIETKLVSSHGVGSLAAASNGIVVAGLGQARVAVSGDLVFLSGLNLGDDALVLGQNRKLSFKADTKNTDVYRLSTGEYKGTISNFGASTVSLTSSANNIFMTTPGCCGTGYAIYNTESLDKNGEVSVKYVNVVIQKNDYSITGGEDGKISLITGREVINTLDLRKATKHTGREDIEIRSLWGDDYDNFIFAASSWGNDSSRSDDLPSFFVLELVNSEQFSVDSFSTPSPGARLGSARQVERAGERANQALSEITSISTAQALEIDQIQIDSTINTGSTSSPAEIDLAGKSVYNYLTKFFLTISSAFKFLFGMIT